MGKDRGVRRTEMNIKPCTFPDGMDVRPDGIHSMSPHPYILKQRLKNVTVEILNCPICGEESIAWIRQSDTEDITDE